MTDLIEAADALAEAVENERNMVCQDIDMQMDASQRVDTALTAYRQARESADGVKVARKGHTMSLPKTPCPWCGHEPYTDTETAEIMGRRTGHRFAIGCSYCEATALGDETFATAISNWESRALEKGDDGVNTDDLFNDIENTLYDCIFNSQGEVSGLDDAYDKITARIKAALED